MTADVKPARASRAGYLREWRARKAVERSEGGFLLPFQRQFVAAVSRTEKPAGVLALSVPRGNGKSWLCGGLVARSVTPDDPLFEPGVENILVSSSYESGADRAGVRPASARVCRGLPLAQ